MPRSLAALFLIASACSTPTPHSGARIDWVAPSSPSAVAGLLAGDLVVASDHGPIATPFDLLELEMVEAPRGPITLSVQRGRSTQELRLPIGEWKLIARSALSGDLEQLDVRARHFVTDEKFAEAATDFEHLAKALEAAGRPRDTCWALLQLGTAYSKAKKTAEADRAFEQARAIARTLGDTALEGHILNAFGDELVTRSEDKKAEQVFREAIQVRNALAPDGLAVAASQYRVGAMMRLHGDFKGAEQMMRQTIAIRERLAPGSIELGLAMVGLGSSTRQRGDDQTAEALYLQALKLREPAAPMGADLAGLYGNLGLVTKNRGDLSGAEVLYRKNLELSERIDPTAYEVAFPLNYLGNLARLKGDTAQAEGYYRRALAVFQKQRPGGLTVAGCLNNLGHNATRQGDFAGAEAFHLQALAVREKLAPESLDVAASVDALGQLATKRGDFAAAEPLLQRALALKLKIAPGTLIGSTTLFALGDLEAARNSWAKALEFYRSALAIRSRLAPGTSDEAESLCAVGKAQRQLGEKRAAAELWAAAIDVVEAQRGRLKDSEDARSGFASNFAELFRDQIDLLVELDRAPEAFNLLERSRAHGFLAMLAQREVGFGAELPAPLLAQQRQLDRDYDKAQGELGKLNPIKDAEQLHTRVNALSELSREREKVAAVIREAAPHAAALSQLQSFDLAQARAVLDPGTALLSYSVGRERTLLFVVTSEGLKVFSLPLTELSLRERVLAFRGLIERGRTLAQPETALLVQAQRLFADLIGPAALILEGQQRVLISADGPLHVLPFAALVRARAPLEYLAEWKPVHAIASASVYAQLRKRRREAPRSSSLVAFGDPAFGARFPQLPASREEVTALAAQFGTASTAYLGDSATEARALWAGSSARYLHFATHGILDRRLPLDSALVLTASEGDNGLLQVWEIIEKLRIDADLVTLSGCETGLGHELGGEGIIGLSRAFQYAGARSVVVSLWSVADHSTAELMKAFYAQLQSGQSKDVALASAQRLLIHSQTWQHPFHWAAFELTGDWK